MSRPRKSKFRSLNSLASVAAFKRWLSDGGASVLPETTAYEIVRFRCSGGLSVIYENTRGRPHAMTGVANECWAAFVGDKPFPYAPSDEPEVLTAAEVSGDDKTLTWVLGSSATVTLADVMAGVPCTMAAATKILHEGVTAGRLTRSGGGAREPLRWLPASPMSREGEVRP